MSYWDSTGLSFVRQSKGKAISQISGPVIPQAEQSPQSKKGRTKEDESSVESADQGNGKKKARKSSSPRKAEKDPSKPAAKKKSYKKKDNPHKLITIQRNIYVERNKLSVPADETPVCECKLENINTDGACEARCINRLVFIECNPDHCPLGINCKNQRFQKREYAPLKRFEAGAKGHGVMCEKDLKKGEFVMEYCGEVLSFETCLQRLKRSRELGEHNFYILTLSGNECVDAARKGNLARFINHSCDPNCETQKWVVDGETCVGIFARRNIPAGTELTFDYQFERVGGDKQRCFCGAAACRGYLGAKKPLDEEAKKGRKEREQQQEMTGRMRVTPFDQVMDVISDPDPPERPPTRVFLLRNAKRGYRKWKRELSNKMPAKVKSKAPEEKEVPLEKAIKMALQAIKMDNPEFNLFD